MTTEQITVPKQTWDVMVEALEQLIACHDEPTCPAITVATEALTAAYAVSHQSPVSIRWLAEMIMSDCGCSANNERLLERITTRIEQYDRANTLQTSKPVPAGYKLVPVIPTEQQWDGLARDMMMWLDMDGRKTAGGLFKHLERCGTSIPQWLRDEPEMKNLDHAPSKGTRVTIIYRAMLEAAPKAKQ